MRTYAAYANTARLTGFFGPARGVVRSAGADSGLAAKLTNRQLRVITRRTKLGRDGKFFIQDTPRLRQLIDLPLLLKLKEALRDTGRPKDRLDLGQFLKLNGPRRIIQRFVEEALIQALGAEEVRLYTAEIIESELYIEIMQKWPEPEDKIISTPDSESGSYFATARKASSLNEEIIPLLLERKGPIEMYRCADPASDPYAARGKNQRPFVMVRLDILGQARYLFRIDISSLARREEELDLLEKTYLPFLTTLLTANKLAGINEELAQMEIDSNVIRGIIHAIKNSLLVLTALTGKTPDGDTSGQIRKKVEELFQLIEALRTTKEIKKERLSLRPLLEQSLDLHGLSLQKNDIEAVIDWPQEKLPEVPVIKNLFLEVMNNLINNAVEAMARRGGGRLTIRPRWDEENKAVKIEVSDTGTGISPENIGRVFSGFSTKEKGMGVGLPWCRDVIANIHGGGITVQSQPGRGTTFTVSLPTEER